MYMHMYIHTYDARSKVAVNRKVCGIYALVAEAYTIYAFLSFVLRSFVLPNLSITVHPWADRKSTENVTIFHSILVKPYASEKSTG